jgi:hypothetical protein
MYEVSLWYRIQFVNRLDWTFSFRSWSSNHLAPHPRLIDEPKLKWISDKSRRKGIGDKSGTYRTNMVHVDGDPLSRIS